MNNPFGDNPLLKTQAIVLNKYLTSCHVIFPERIMISKEGKNVNWLDLDSDNLAALFPIGKSIQEQNLFYVNLLIGTMSIMLPEYRQPFLAYQASIHKDPVLFLDLLSELMDSYEVEITDILKKTPYKKYKLIIRKLKAPYERFVERVKPPVRWNGKSVQFVELVLALYSKSALKYDTDKIDTVNKLIAVMADMFKYDISDISDWLKSIRRRKRLRGKFLKSLNESLRMYMYE